jgi:hypothetical protein
MFKIKGMGKGPKHSWHNKMFFELALLLCVSCVLAILCACACYSCGDPCVDLDGQWQRHGFGDWRWRG